MNGPVQREAVVAESLSTALDRVYRRLAEAVSSHTSESAWAIEAAPSSTEQPDPRVRRLQAWFGMSDFERDILLLCAGVSIESRFAAACAAIHDNPQARWPTFGLVLSVLEQPHWSAISRTRPLRHWRLIETTGNGDLLHASLQIDERILQYLLGVSATDERLDALIRPLSVDAYVANPDRTTRLDSLLNVGIRHWQRHATRSTPLLLCGERGVSRDAVFVALCQRCALRAYQLDIADLPTHPEDRERMARLWTRESVLLQAALYIRCADHDNLQALTAWLERTQARVAIDVPAGSPAEQLDGLRLDVPALSAQERKAAWLNQLGPAAARMNGTLDRIVEYFHFDESAIGVAATATLETSSDTDDLGEIAWRTCRQHGRRSLDNLARRIEPRASWSQLVLPPAQTEILQQIAIHMRQRAVVNQQWGFAERFSRGHGLSALFSGGSGTGKTMAAEILARELNLDLYQIDLASLVSKYIGETEKNLRKIFDKAEESGAVMLFDEADALFGKRSEVRDSHDRYANLEVSYLLQRMDSYRGVAILTTNMRHAMDTAFLRRIRFIVQFPFPDAPSRARIWQGIFPPAAPLDALNFEQLAQLNISGAVIRNIATHAAFLAAERGTPIGPQQVLTAARIEYAKMDKPLTQAETRGWS